MLSSDAVIAAGSVTPARPAFHASPNASLNGLPDSIASKPAVHAPDRPFDITSNPPSTAALTAVPTTRWVSGPPTRVIHDAAAACAPNAAPPIAIADDTKPSPKPLMPSATA